MGQRHCRARVLQGGPESCVPLPRVEVVLVPLPSCQRLCPTVIHQQLQPAGHGLWDAGEMKIFPGRERRQEPIHLSVSRPYQWFFTLQGYFVPLATFIKKITFSGTMWRILVSVQGPLELVAGSAAACTGTSALQCCWALEQPARELPAGK